MAQTVRLDGDLVAEAKVFADAFSRSLPKQIEHWVQIGRMVEANPELSYNIISDILIATAEVKHGLVLPYRRTTERNKN